MDERARPADQLDVVAGEDELVLDRRRPLDRDARKHVHHAHALLPQEVADLHLVALALNVDVDGELDLSIKENHFSESVISQTQDCYEKYFYYLNNLGIKRP